jgi:TolB-like protein/Flp pilus assembly protein TadD
MDLNSVLTANYLDKEDLCGLLPKSKGAHDKLTFSTPLPTFADWSMVPPPTEQSRTLSFGPYVVDLRTGELRKKGYKIRLQEKSFQILSALLERPGELVTREELCQRLWTGNTFVDWDNGLNTALKKLRDALGDSAEKPRYIETFPKRGYRFIALPSSAALDRIIMLAVLPFENLSGDVEQEYFSDGLTEEMITALAQLKPERLRVIARTSSMSYKKTRKGVDKIARELGVDWLLEGSVRPGSERVRITAQLIRTEDQSHLWARTYDRDLRDILVVQTEVALAIAGEIQLQLEPDVKARIAEAPKVNREAHNEYLLGSFYLTKFTGEGIGKAIQHLLRSIDIDPNHAPAHEVLASAYFLASVWMLPANVAIERARTAAKRALEIDDSLAEAHASLGIVLMHDWDWPAAEVEFKRAIELNAGSLKSHEFYGWYLAALGRFEEAIEEERRALELDPVSAEINTFMGHVLYLARRYDEAIEYLNQALALDKNYWFAHLVLGLTYQQQFRMDDAIEAFQKARHSENRGPEPIGALGQALAVSGDKDKAITVLEELQRWSQRHNGAAFHMARIHAALGEKERAFAWLDTAYEERSFFLSWLKVEPELDPLRSDPFFNRMMERLAFPNNNGGQ